MKNWIELRIKDSSKNISVEGVIAGAAQPEDSAEMRKMRARCEYLTLKDFILGLKEKFLTIN